MEAINPYLEVTCHYWLSHLLSLSIHIYIYYIHTETELNILRIHCSFILLQIKQSENEAALSQLGERLCYLDSLKGEAKQTELAIGMLAGNLFDWGAKAVVQIMEMEQFGLTEARRRIPSQ